MVKRRRSSAIIFAAMLLLHTVFANVGITYQAFAGAAEPSVVSDGRIVDENSGSELRTVEFQWTLHEQVNIEEVYWSKVPVNTTVTEAQSGELSYEGEEFGTYVLAENGSVSVKFDERIEGLPETATGTFEVDVVVEGENISDYQSVVNQENEEQEEKLKEIAETNDDREPKAITENIIDELKLFYEGGTEYQDGDFLELGEDLRLELDWSLPNDHEYKTGDYFEFQLPKQLQVYNEITGDLGEYGSYLVATDGKVTFTFNEEIEYESNINGNFWFDTELDEQEIKSTTEELEIIFDDDVAKKITINVKPIGGQAIHKEGQPVDGSFNTEEIQWKVLVNTTRDELVNAIVYDPILEGQELVLDSIKLQEVEVDIQGNVVKELGEVYVTNSSTINELKLELGDTNKAYKLIFKTKITEDEKNKEGWLWYENTAYLNSNGQDEKQSGAGVSVQRPESLVKTSSNFDAEDRSVEWEVKANFTEKQLSAGDTIVDEFTFTVGENELNDVFEIIEEEIEILQVDRFDINGNPIDTSNAKDLFDINIDGNKITYTLKEDSNKAFILKYKTQAKDGSYITDNGTIFNKVEIDGKTDESSQGIIQQVGKKTNAGIDYENKIIDWTITINADKQDLRGFVLTDDFAGSGQKLVDGSIKISPEKQDASIDLSPADVPEGEGFEIDFGDITDTYTITYQTEFIYDFDGEGTPNFANKVNISYETNDGNDYELEIEDKVDPNEETKSNGAKNGWANNETKEITWTVDINYNQLELSDAKVVDAIADNQSLINGSVKIYETTIGENGGITVGDDVTEQFTVTSNENQVDVDFGEIDQSYRVEFMTKDKDGVYNSNEVYENTAQFIPRGDEGHNLTANVTLPNQGEFLGKSGFHNKEDWTIDWEVDVNKSKSKLTDVKVKDDLGRTDVQILLRDTIKVTKAGSNEELVEGEDYELTVNGNVLIVHFPGEITDHYKVTYSSYIVTEEDADIKNEAEIESVDEIIVGSTDKTEIVQVKISTGGGTGQGETGGLVIEKVEAGTERALEGVAFELVKEVGNQEIVVREGTTDADGKLEWKGLKFGDYMLNEVIPEGYLGEEEQFVTISSEDPEGIKTLTIENDRQTGTAQIVKVDAVTSDKLSGAEFEITNETTGQTYMFTTDENGEISEEVPFGEYTVEEITAPNGYRVTEDIENIIIEIGETTTIEVANIAFVDVAGSKTWISDEDLDHPTITVYLLANGTQIDDTQASADTNWEYSFTNLDKYDENGEEIVYSIEEVEVDGYLSEKDGFDLTNIQTIAISGEKNWVEVDEQYRPDSITVKLLADGEEVNSKEVKVNDDGEWTFTFEGLAKYDADGNAIEYTIEEVDVAGYTSEIEGYTITNTQERTELSGIKTWLDNNSEDRPETITVQVKNGDSVVQETAVTADDEWRYTFTDLPKYDKEGNEITYTVDEIDVEGYEKSIEENNITNLRVGTTEVVVTKLWKDENGNDRPDTITINVLQNNEFYDEYEVTAENDWELTITGLPQYNEEGVAYEYTITEHDVAGYAAEVDGFDITNTRADVKTIEINKAWLDDDSADRPDSIEVELFRSVTDGDLELVDTYTVSAEDNWSLEVIDLPAFDNNGKAYTYEIEEKAVEGYETRIHGFDITNLRVGETEVSGEKTWKDDDANDRPASITVQVMHGDEVIQEQEVTAEDDWTFTFTDLAKYDAEGNEIEYTINELPVPGYATDIDGFDITNTRVEVLDVAGTKTWKDDTEADRPDSITVQLLANGEVVDSIEVTAVTDWTYIFEDLPGYDENGVAITYGVDEVEVEGYETTINGYDITNTLIPVEGEKPGTPGDPKDPTDKGKGDTLPKTATNIFNLLMAGIVLVGLGLTVLYIQRKRVRQTNEG